VEEKGRKARYQLWSTSRQGKGEKDGFDGVCQRPQSPDGG